MVNDFIILGADTDAGKTTFALLWLSAFADGWEYWKPVETGDSDTAKVTRLVPGATVHAPVRRYSSPVAPPLAARMEGASIPAARAIASSMPHASIAGRDVVIETFGSPYSPLNEGELQIALIRELDRPCVLVTSTSLGAIGRTLQCLAALRVEGIAPVAVILIGRRDEFAAEQIAKQGGIPVVALDPPAEWTPGGVAASAARQIDRLNQVRTLVERVRHPSSPAALLADDRRSVWHPYTPLLGADEPLACVGAKDEFLRLADGRRVIDAISSWWTILHGHRHPVLMQALAEASGTIDHVMFAGVTHRPAVELADLLLGTMPWAGGRVFYSDNGSTAVEVALKMAHQYWQHRGETGRRRFVGFEHGYHGDTFGAMAVSRDPVFFGRFEPLLFQADILPLDADRLDAHLAKHRQETSAAIIEPLVQGAGGMRMHTPDTLRQIAQVCARHDVLLIADEVMTGGGRTGTLWAHQAAGIVPDLVCAAKTLTGGIMPLAATLVSPKVVNAFLTDDRQQTFFHGHSFTAHPLACAVAAANWRHLLSVPLAAPARLERFWQRAFEPLRDDRRAKEIRIRGSIAAIEVNAEGGYLADVGSRMRRVALERGVMLRPLGSVLYAMPPYCTSEESLERIADAMIAGVRISS
jgi:adenosylmethionine-8-amino-7-oxononanoate aminotransferase